MKIAIDARMYGLEHAGIGRYVMNLVQKVAKIDTNNTYEILLRKEYDFLDFPPKWRKHIVDVRHYTLKEQIVVSRLLKKLAPDITHFPHFNVPLMYDLPFVVTIHDLSKHRSKGKDSTTLPYLYYLLKRTAYGKVFNHAIYNSKKIIVPTNFVMNDILSHYKIPEDKVVVTYEGLSLSGKRNTDDKIIEKYHLSRPYFIFTGSAYPHKNIDRLIEAMVHLNEQADEEVFLAISSSRSVFTERLESLIKQKRAGKYVKLLGFVSDEDLSALYKYSTGFVYPSLMEGFGLPGLEAMESGTLALVSDIPVFKEVYNDKAIYFNPYDFTAIAKAMKDALGLKREERRRKIAAGQSFIKKYSWNDMAKGTIKVYENSVGVR